MERKAAAEALALWHGVTITVTSKTTALKVVRRYQNFATKKFTKEVLEFLYGVKDNKKEVPRRNRVMGRMDIWGIIVRGARDKAWGREEEVSAATLLVVDAFHTVNQHCYYTKRVPSTDDDKADKGDIVDIHKEAYSATVEARIIV